MTPQLRRCFADIGAKMVSKYGFPDGHEVPLLHWHDLDRATTWCEEEWNLNGTKYRRQIKAASQQAIFVLPTELAAVDFKLRFG